MQHSKQLVKYLFVVVCFVSGTIFATEETFRARVLSEIYRILKADEEVRNITYRLRTANPIRNTERLKKVFLQVIVSNRKLIEKEEIAERNILLGMFSNFPEFLYDSYVNYVVRSAFGPSESMSHLTLISPCCFPVTPPNHVPGPWGRQLY